MNRTVVAALPLSALFFAPGCSAPPGSQEPGLPSASGQALAQTGRSTVPRTGPPAPGLPSGADAVEEPGTSMEVCLRWREFFVPENGFDFPAEPPLDGLLGERTVGPESIEDASSAALQVLIYRMAGGNKGELHPDEKAILTGLAAQCRETGVSFVP